MSARRGADDRPGGLALPGTPMTGPDALAPVGAGVVAVHRETEHILTLLAEIAGRYSAGAFLPPRDADIAACAASVAPDITRIAADLAMIRARLWRAARVRNPA